MTQVSKLNEKCRENASFLCLILAFFAPFNVNSGKAVMNCNMIPTYAALYMIRNGIAALATCLLGAILSKSGFTVTGTIIIGLFVVFAGGFSAFLAAAVDSYRNPR